MSMTIVKIYVNYMSCSLEMFKLCSPILLWNIPLLSVEPDISPINASSSQPALQWHKVELSVRSNLTRSVL